MHQKINCLAHIQWWCTGRHCSADLTDDSQRIRGLIMARLVKGRLVMSESEYLEADELYLGYCLGCGSDQGECEPDVRGRVCESCGARRVYGAQELLIMDKVILLEGVE